MLIAIGVNYTGPVPWL